MKNLLTVLLLTCQLAVFSQPVQSSSSSYWQQRVKYTMNIDMNVQTNRFTGKQKLEYWNNSPDTLKKVFYHLYFNAFQPGSMMDTRSRRQGTIQIGNSQDWDARVMDRISRLKPDEIGYQKIISLKMNGRPQNFNMLETILEVKLDKPIPPRTRVEFDMDFEAQVPLQVRRSGRDNPNTKVRYSMSQWYPKICEYDGDGWHPTPYIAREFYGVWGDFDVSITIDKKYILGGTGYLQNPTQIGYGYEDAGAKITRPAGDKLTWRFIAPNVHDFMWAADPDYIHKSVKLRDDLTIHLLYKATTNTAAEWESLFDIAKRAFPFIEKTFGAYPYKQFSFITGGDGGMEYPMATLLAGTGGAVHELMHSWYYGILGSNESENPWMDEGFAQYAGARVWAFLNGSTGFAQADNYNRYFSLVRSGREEPMTTHADHFNTNYSSAAAAYYKGCVFIEQLGYITGAQVRDSILLEYYRQWKFKHPAPSDFLRVAEKLSDMKLDWYKQYWVNSTKTIDYAFDSLWEEKGKTKIRIRRKGMVPMPIDLKISFRDSTSEMHYIPLDLMYGQKPVEDDTPRKIYPAWKWTSETYIVESDRRIGEIILAEIDPSQRMADIERQNNRIKLQ